jgi:hypothetical protein
LRELRDTLLVGNRENYKALGDFGYDVDDSAQTPASSRICRGKNAMPAESQTVLIFTKTVLRKPRV